VNNGDAFISEGVVRRAAQQVAEVDVLVEGLIVAGLGSESCLFLLGITYHPHAA
jgi:hypothetical protein